MCETDGKQERKGVSVSEKMLNLEEWRRAVIATERGNLVEVNSVESSKKRWLKKKNRVGAESCWEAKVTC